MCYGNDKLKPNANMTWGHKYHFICISPLGNILHTKIFQRLNVDTRGERETCCKGTTKQFKNVP